jgi:Flp pilus assembly pilin Flp
MRASWERLHFEERGAQAAEYAMLGGVSAAACGALVAVLKNKSTLSNLVDVVFNGLVRLVGQWM